MAEEVLHKILNHLENMNKRLDSLERDFSEVKSSQHQLISDLSDVKSSQSILKKNITDVKLSQSMLEANQIRLENTLSAKVDILFDAWQQHEDYFDSNANCLTRLEEKLDKLELKAAKIDSTQDQHTDLLSKLTASSDSHEIEIMALKRAK